MSRVLYVQYTNPAGYPPLQHSSRILADAGWEVLFLGTGASGAGTLEFPPHRNITVRRMPFCQPGWRQKLHFLRFCAWVIRTVLIWRPQWIYASDPFACPVAALLTYMPGLKVLYHEHDTPARQTGNAFPGFIAASRKRVARTAQLCVLPNEQRLARFVGEAGPVRAVACVWNCPARDEAAPALRPPVSGKIWLLYHGSIVPDRLPVSVIHALARLPDHLHLRVAGYETAGSRGYTDQLRLVAQQLGIEHRLELLGPIPQRADLLRETLKSDLGLALMPLHSSDFNCQTMTGASNKAFDYLACGLALIVSDRPDWREMFVDPGYALACDPDDPDSLEHVLRQWIGDPGHMRARGEAGRQRILHEWNYEAVFQPVLRHMLQQ